MKKNIKINNLTINYCTNNNNKLIDNILTFLDELRQSCEKLKQDKLLKEDEFYGVTKTIEMIKKIKLIKKGNN